MGLHKSGSLLEAISKQLRIPQASVQITVCNLNLDKTQTLHCSGSRHKLTPRNETLVQKVQLNLMTKELVKESKASGTKVCISTIKRLLNHNGLKDCHTYCSRSSTSIVATKTSIKK